MSKPILVYTIISSFMIPWTDFVMAKMILNSGLSADWTVAIGLFNMLQRTLINNYFALFCAGGVLVSVPISILFIIMQNLYGAGFPAGAYLGSSYTLFYTFNTNGPPPCGGAALLLKYAEISWLDLFCVPIILCKFGKP